MGEVQLGQEERGSSRLVRSFVNPMHQGVEVGTSYGARRADAPHADFDAIGQDWTFAYPPTHFPMASLSTVRLKFGEQGICLLVNTVPTDRPNFRPI